MSASRLFFIGLAAAIALLGLFAAAASTDYLQIFGFMLMGFGVFFALSCVKRHYDEGEAARR